jgi:hypothetical protein
MFYWSWAGGPVLIVRTACCSRNVLCFTGLEPEDWCSSWGLLVVPETCYGLLVLGRRTGTHRENCLLFQKRVMFYWSWAGGLVLIVKTACCSRNVLCFTGLGPEDWYSSWGLFVVLETCYVLLVLGRRTGAHREYCLLFQKRVMGTKLNIYVCITGFQNKSVRYIKKCDHRNTVDYDVLKIILLPSRYI